MEQLENYLAAKKKIVNEALDSFLYTETTYPPQIHEAMRYSVEAGGKRLRPILVIAAAEACGGRAETVLPCASSLELLHTYSLIHDDLPAMDDDDFRRGKPTCHKVYGEAIAILAGDALLTQSFNLLSRQVEYGVPAEAVLKVILEISAAAGSRGMIGGQVMDLAAEKQEVAPETLEYIHAHKTGALFKAALRSGGILVGANAEKLVILTSYAEHFGLAFQITDDILDITGETDKLGKSVGSDTRKEKATYPVLYGLEGAKAMASQQVGKAVQEAEKLGKGAWPLVKLAESLLTRQS